MELARLYLGYKYGYGLVRTMSWARKGVGGGGVRRRKQALKGRYASKHTGIFINSQETALHHLRHTLADNHIAKRLDTVCKSV